MELNVSVAPAIGFSLIGRGSSKAPLEGALL